MLESMKQKLQQMLSQRRYAHSIGVMNLSKELAQRHGCSVEKAELAGLLHDCAKELSEEQTLQILDSLGSQVDPLTRSMRSLWHAPAGAVLCRELFGIDDAEIYEAIFYHTVGKPGMNCLTEIIYIADLTEEGRDAYLPWAPAMRELAKEDLHEALIGVIDRTMFSLIEQHKCIHPLTVEVRNRALQKR